MAEKVTGQDSVTSINQVYDLLGGQVIAGRGYLHGDTFKDAYLDTANSYTDGSTVSGSVSEASGVLSLNTGATASSKGRLYTQRKWAVVGGATSIFKTRLRLPEDMVAGNTRSFGLESADEADRIYFVFSGVSPYARIEKATDDDSSTEPITLSLDWTKFHDFEIKATASEVRMLVDNTPVANFSSLGSASALIEQTLLRPFWTAENGANNDERGMDVDSYDLSRYPDPWLGRRIQSSRAAVDTQVFRGPGLLVWTIGQQSGGMPAWDYYDGTGNGVAANKIYSCISTIAEYHNMCGPIEVSKGLYLDRTTAAGSITTGFVK